MIGSGRTAQKDAILGHGVDTFLDLEQDQLEDVGEVDVVFDVLGGGILDRSAQLVRSGGSLVTIAEPPRVRPEGAQAIFFIVEPDRPQLSELERRLQDRQLRHRGSGVPAHRRAVGVRPGSPETREDRHPSRRAMAPEPAFARG